MINTKYTTHMPRSVIELCVIFLLALFSQIAAVQSGEILELEKQSVKLLTVEDVLGKDVIDWPFYGRLIVLPPQNKTGDSELDWVGIAIQEAMTIDLWYVNAFETLSLPQFSSIYKTSCPKLMLACVQKTKPETAIAALKDKVPSHIVQGTYHLDGDKLLIGLQWETLNSRLQLPKKGKPPRFTTSLSKLTDDLSEHLINWAQLSSAQLFRGDQGLASVAELNKLIPLPSTGPELRNLAQAFQIDDEKRLFLQQRATEPQFKDLNKDGTLKNQRVIAFATHALQASEIGGISESGLVFTPPETPSKENDGYLTAIEVSRLKLNADWVLLSACNTGTVISSELENGQSDNLSSLAKSFFSAGSRNLLVTQWPVNDEAGSQLMSDLFKDPDRHKGKALQQAMLKFIDHGIDRNNYPSGDWVCRANAKLQGWVAQLSGDSQKAHSYTHPAYWAPYRILGSGE